MTPETMLNALSGCTHTVIRPGVAGRWVCEIEFETQDDAEHAAMLVAITPLLSSQLCAEVVGLVKRLNAIGEEEMYQQPATTRGAIEEAVTALTALNAERMRLRDECEALRDQVAQQGIDLADQMAIAKAAEAQLTKAQAKLAEAEGQLHAIDLVPLEILATYGSADAAFLDGMRAAFEHIKIAELRKLVSQSGTWWASPRRMVLEFHTIQDAREFREALKIKEPEMEGWENGAS